MASLTDALVQQLLSGRYIASLATENGDGSIHMVAVWYWFDGAKVYVATSKRSRKARNLQARAKVSLMIDSRDPYASRGVTLAGTGQVLTGELSQQWNARIHRKYLSAEALADDRVGGGFAAMDDATLQIMPISLVAWDMRDADRQVFGGALERNPGYLLTLER